MGANSRCSFSNPSRFTTYHPDLNPGKDTTAAMQLLKVEIGLQTFPQGAQLGLYDLIQLGGIHTHLFSQGILPANDAVAPGSME